MRKKNKLEMKCNRCMTCKRGDNHYDQQGGISTSYLVSKWMRDTNDEYSAPYVYGQGKDHDGTGSLKNSAVPRTNGDSDIMHWTNISSTNSVGMPLHEGIKDRARVSRNGTKKNKKS